MTPLAPHDRARQPATVLPPDARWVLIQGWHDQGGAEAVYGPYTEKQADWLLVGPLENSTYNWTKAELQRMPED